MLLKDVFEICNLLFYFKNVLRASLIVFYWLQCSSVSYTCLDIGIMYSWPSSTIQQFSSGNTTLNRPMTDTEQALFGSLFSVTALISNPLSGFSLNLIGRKKSCILFMLTQVVSLISFFYNDLIIVRVNVFFTCAWQKVTLTITTYVCLYTTLNLNISLSKWV